MAMTEAYPDEITCNKPHIWFKNQPCDGQARRYETPLFAGRENAGPWYGCSKCGRIGQYADFIRDAEAAASGRLYVVI